MFWKSGPYVGKSGLPSSALLLPENAVQALTGKCFQVAQTPSTPLLMIRFPCSPRSNLGKEIDESAQCVPKPEQASHFCYPFSAEKIAHTLW